MSRKNAKRVIVIATMIAKIANYAEIAANASRTQPALIFLPKLIG
jgi:hypothetical protein